MGMSFEVPSASRRYDAGIASVHRGIEVFDMTEDLIIRRGTLDDAEACATILNAWIDETPWMPRIHGSDAVMRHYREVVLAKRDVWIAGEPIAGYLGLDPDTQEVTSLYSATPGQGVGKALLDRAKECRHTLSLWTFKANEAAQRFYIREGFREVERSDGDNEERLPDIQYRWDRWPIRRAEPQDAVACAAILDRWVDRADWIPRLYDVSEFEEMIRTAMPEREIYLIDDPVAGYLSLDPEHAHIGAIYVDEPGAGKGKALLDRVKEERDYLRLNTHEANTGAQKFYKREGFEVVERYDEGCDGIPELRLEWRR